MPDATCLECGAKVDDCWRWCPECGSLRLRPPGGRIDLRWGDDFSVEWEMDEPDGTGGHGDRFEVGSRA